MKTLSYLFLSLFIFSLAACSSDDDDDNGSQPVNILGKWDIAQMTMEGTAIDEGVVVRFDGVSNELPGNDITFHEDNTLSGNSASFEMRMNYFIDGRSMQMTLPMSSLMAHEGIWSQEGDILYIQENSSSARNKYNIDMLNATTLILSGDQNSLDMGSDFTPGAQFRVTITFKR